MIVAGERRYRAARLAGLATLICVEAKGVQSPDDRLEDQLVENCVREDLKPVEQARAFRALLDRRGCTYRQLAESLNISHQAIVPRWRCWTCPTTSRRRSTPGPSPPPRPPRSPGSPTSPNVARSSTGSRQAP